MSFRDFNVEDEFAEMAGDRREFFSKDSYGFRKLGKLEELDAALVEKLRARRWKLANPERCAELKAESLARLNATDPDGQRAMRRRRKKKWQAKNPETTRAMARRTWARRKDRPEVKAAALARAKAHYEAAKKDPAKLERIRQSKREYARRKAALRKALS